MIRSLRLRALPFALFASPLFAQSAEPGDHYIEGVFQARLGEVPQMGWFDPSRGFIANTRARLVYLYAPVGLTSTGERVGDFTGDDIRVAHLDGLACEHPVTDHLTQFVASGGGESERALYTTKKLDGPSRSGLISVALTPATMSAVNAALKWPASGVLRRDEAVATRVGITFFSIHKLYSTQTRLLTEEALVLHRATGEVVAFDLRRNLDKADFCADCDNPAYEDSFGLYRPLNVFELPGFPNPVMLMDTSTVEGRALSLVTFTPAGKKAEFRVYEHVVNCR